MHQNTHKSNENSIYILNKYTHIIDYNKYLFP